MSYPGEGSYESMNVTIDLSDDHASALASRARAARMPTERFIAHILERALERQRRQASAHLRQHLERMASQIPPETTPEQMEAALEEALTAVRPRRDWEP